MADDLQDRIRRKAHEIWESEGRPEGREAEHWDMASELVAIEDRQRETLRENPMHHKTRTGVLGETPIPGGEPIEPLSAVESQGDDAVSPQPEGDRQPAPFEEVRKNMEKTQRATGRRHRRPSGT